MKSVRTHYLRWDEKDSKGLLNIFVMGYRDIHCMMEEKYYRSYDMEFDESCTPEDIFCLLNQDDRHNGQYERSMCVGDVIELDGILYGVESIGFKELMRVA